MEAFGYRILITIFSSGSTRQYWSLAAVLPGNTNVWLLFYQMIPILGCCVTSRYRSLAAVLPDDTDVDRWFCLQSDKMLSTASEWVMALSMAIIFATFASEFKAIKFEKPKVSVINFNWFI